MIPIYPTRNNQESREEVPSELSFVSAPRKTDPMPVVTLPREGTRPESTSAMVTRSRAREGRWISVVPEAQIEPEIETPTEQEMATCEGGLGLLDHLQPTLLVWLHLPINRKQLPPTLVRKQQKPVLSLHPKPLLLTPIPFLLLT